MFYSHCNFQVYNIVLLTIVSVMYIRSSELTFLTNESFCPLMSNFPFTSPQPLMPIFFYILKWYQIESFKIKKKYKRSKFCLQRAIFFTCYDVLLSFSSFCHIEYYLISKCGQLGPPRQFIALIPGQGKRMKIKETGELLFLCILTLQITLKHSTCKSRINLKLVTCKEINMYDLC